MKRNRMRHLILCGLMVLPAAAQDDSRKTEIDNNLVQVTRRAAGPHQTVSVAGMPPSLLVFVSDCPVRLTTATRQEELRGKPGEFVWHGGGRVGLENLSDRRLEVVQVEPKFSPGSEAVSAALNRRSMVFENDLVHMKRFHLAPARTAQTPRADPGPDHVLPAVVIHLSAAHIKFTHADGRVEELSMKAGDIRFEGWGFFSRESPRMKVSAEKPGDLIDVVRIQLKAGKLDCD